MRDPAFRTRAGPAIALAALAVIQFAFLGRPPDTDREGYVAVGDDLSGVRVRGADGFPRPLAAQDAVLVLVFDPECEHSQRVAPEWRSWLQSATAPPHVVALAPGPSSRAREYAGEQRVDPAGRDDRRRPPRKPGTRADQPYGPWIFALDGSGRVTAQGHGSDVSAIAATLKRPPGGAVRSPVRATGVVAPMTPRTLPSRLATTMSMPDRGRCLLGSRAARNRVPPDPCRSHLHPLPGAGFHGDPGSRRDCGGNLDSGCVATLPHPHRTLDGIRAARREARRGARRLLLPRGTAS